MGTITVSQKDGTPDGVYPVALGDDTVNTADVVDDAITGAKVLDATIDTADLAASAVTNAKIAVPKIEVYQESFAFGDMTDGTGTSGTYELDYTIPAGAIVQQVTINALTGFTGDTSAVITVGDGSTVDRYNTGTPNVFVTAIPGVALGAVSGTAWHTAAATPTITITGAADFSSITAGAVTVTLFVIRPV